MAKLGLGQELYKMILDNSVVPESEDVIQKENIYGIISKVHRRQMKKLLMAKAEAI